MSKFADTFIRTAQRILPAPFTIAILLTGFTFLLAYLCTTPPENTTRPYALQLLEYWEGSFFDFLSFAMQMAMVLVLGYVLALTKPAERMIQYLLRFCTSTASAAAIVSMLCILVAFFNWGLALILGAVFARKVGEHARQHNIPLNYPLIGAAGYIGLMVFHGGISGSAPLEVAKTNHRFVQEMGVLPFGETIFSTTNLICMLLLFLVVPLSLYLLGRRVRPTQDLPQPKAFEAPSNTQAEGAARLDYSPWLAPLVGGLMLFVAAYKVWAPIWYEGAAFDWSFSFINPNYLIFILFGLGLMLHGSFAAFVKAVETGIGSSTGIMIQFPLYAGIMGIMIDSGLVVLISDFFTAISTAETFPIFTFFSAGLVNIFVPSGGGQWLVQGPILIETAQKLDLPLAKCVLALCYGDQITNMLQPFWALPLLGITGLKARDILPYTLFLFLVGSVIFLCVLWFL